MPKVRVLVVDDAVVMRRLLTEVLQCDPGIEVVGTAPNGRIALQKLTQVNPDLVTLDVEMPDLDGVATLRELRLTHPKLPVIMLSALTRRGGQATLDSLAAGANDYVTKPSDTKDLEAAMRHLSQELLQKIRIHCPAYPAPAPAAPAAGSVGASRTRFSSSRSFELVVLATSTGGPNALADFFAGIRTRVPVPIAIVQHMPPMFTQLLAARLNALPTALRCQEAADGDLMLPGHAYLAPGGRHLAVTRDTAGRFIARLRDTVPENSCRPAADVLFRSAAETGAHLLGVVLTGMGQDGMRGSELIVERGGEIIAQDQATSVVWGMPGSVVQAGLADKVLPLPEIAGEVVRRLRAPQLVPS